MDKAADILKEFLSFYNFAGGEKYAALFSSWRKMAGDDIASHSRVVDLRKGALIVEVDHPGWMQTLQMKREEILKKLAANYPDLHIRMLQLKLAKDGQFSPPPGPEAAFSPEDSSPPEASLSAEPRKKAPLENRQDEELKNILARLEKSLKRKKK